MNETASPDVLRLLALAAGEPGAGYARIFAALGLEAPADPTELRAAHTEAFVTQCMPYASIYIGQYGAIGGEAADRAAGFRRLLGADVGQGENAAPDHLCDLLADYAELAAMGDDAQARHARKALLWEHLLSWLLPFCDAVTRAAPAPYDGWAATVRDVFVAEARAAGQPAQLPLQLRCAPAFDVGTNAESLADAARAVFVPAATGLVITRADLDRAAPAIGAGAVPGSRVFMLETLLGQEPGATLCWLAAEAASQADARAAEIADLGAVARFWAERARASQNALAVMADRAALAGQT